MAEEAKEGKEGAEAAAQPKSKKKLFIIIGAVLLLLVAAGVPLMLMGGSKPEGDGHGEKHEEAHEEKHLVTAQLDTFIVNLSETGAFLKVRMLMEYDETAIHKAEEELAKKGHGGGGGGGGHDAKPAAGLEGYLGTREPMIRDAIIRILSSKRSTEVLTLDGKEKLKEEVIEGLNEAIGLEDSPVQSIYFAEFIIQ